MNSIINLIKNIQKRIKESKEKKLLRIHYDRIRILPLYSKVNNNYRKKYQ